MTAIYLHSGPFGLLKRYARRQFPAVKHTHMLEALSRALGVQTWAALAPLLQSAPPFTSQQSAVSRTVATDALFDRLVELGYPEASSWSISFASLENGADIVADTGWPIVDTSNQSLDPSRDRATLADLFTQWPLTGAAREMLVDLVIHRAPGSDLSDTIQSAIPLASLGRDVSHRGPLRGESGGPFPFDVPSALSALHRVPVEFRQDNAIVGFPILQSFSANRETGTLHYRFSELLREALFALRHPELGIGPRRD